MRPWIRGGWELLGERPGTLALALLAAGALLVGVELIGGAGAA